MKGDPEHLVNSCSTILVNGVEYQLDDSWKQTILEAQRELLDKGERPVGFCDFLLPPEQYPLGYAFSADDGNFPLTGLRFVGLVSVIRPPRAAVPDDIARCRSAGIRVSSGYVAAVLLSTAVNNFSLKIKSCEHRERKCTENYNK